jgi:hypothetical protein
MRFYNFDFVQFCCISLTFAFVMMILKVCGKILVSLELGQNLESSDLAMAKDEEVNIAVTYSNLQRYGN